MLNQNYLNLLFEDSTFFLVNLLKDLRLEFADYRVRLSDTLSLKQQPLIAPKLETLQLTSFAQSDLFELGLTPLCLYFTSTTGDIYTLSPQPLP